jgi:tRNA modification GTPase
VSVKTGVGIEDLKQKIVEHYLVDDNERDQVIVTNLRHQQAIEVAEEALQNMERNHKAKLGWDVQVHELREAVTSLGKVTGETTEEDIVEQIFGRFCIGK